MIGNTSLILIGLVLCCHYCHWVLIPCIHLYMTVLALIQMLSLFFPGLISDISCPTPPYMVLANQSQTECLKRASSLTEFSSQSDPIVVS